MSYRKGDTTPMTLILMSLVISWLFINAPISSAQPGQAYPEQLQQNQNNNSNFQPSFNNNYNQHQSWSQSNRQPTGYPTNYTNNQNHFNNANAYPDTTSNQSTYYFNQPSTQSANNAALNPAQRTQFKIGAATELKQWFANYDQIRRSAQMNQSERQQADNLLSRGLSLVMPGPEKQVAKALLISLAARYQKAYQQLSALPHFQQTQAVHQAYYYYFANAAQLFFDYVRVQDNLFLTDNSGQPVAGGLLQRKQQLEAIEHQAKSIDAQTRNQYGLAAYKY